MMNSIYSRFRRITTNQLYFPEIDGIRFLAITLVVLFHIHGYFIKKSPFTENMADFSILSTLLKNAERGVELFFVLSGFILCLPFAHHYVNKGKKVSLKNYYLRRLTRLEPPYILALTAILLMHIAINSHPVDVLIPHWLASLVYAHNIIYHHVPMLTVVAWSLEVEIQFYLLAPLLFTIFALPKPVRRSILLVSIIVLVFLKSVYIPTYISLYVFIQYFLIGMLLADFYVSDSFSTIFNKKWMSILAVVCLVTILYMPIKSRELPPSTLFAAKLSFPFLVGLFYYSVLKNDVLKKVFSYKFIPIIGGMCYSIYLLHYTIISVIGRYTKGIHISNNYLLNLSLQVILMSIPILVLSSLYYYYVERPFMSRKWLEMLIKKDRRPKDINIAS